MRENHDFVVPVNILTTFAHAPFSWAARHTTVCLDVRMPTYEISVVTYPSKILVETDFITGKLLLTKFVDQTFARQSLSKIKKREVLRKRAPEAGTLSHVATIWRAATTSNNITDKVVN